MNHRTLRFGPVLKARFIERPNRFLVRCHVQRQGTVEAFLPNPGRLWELFFPDVTLHLTPNAPPATKSREDRKTKYTVLAVERDGQPIFLHTHFTNQVARFLVEEDRIPELAGAEVIRPEVPVGHSRFDFLLRHRRRKVYLEVKSCTLFGNGVAMFPDAVTDRGRRHLVELASLRSRSVRTCVLFLVQTPDVHCFMPDYHTDLAFSRTLLEVRDKLDILPVAIQWASDLSLCSDVKPLEVPWRYLRREVKDQGSYLLLLRLDKGRRIQVGALGTVTFRRGWYVYVGSAMRNLSARIARHARRRKKVHWHIDYLRNEAAEVIALPIRSSLRQECDVAQALTAVLQSGPTGFGSSDCDCSTHLFYHAASPLDSRPFHKVLQQFRMRHPGSCTLHASVV